MTRPLRAAADAGAHDTARRFPWKHWLAGVAAILVLTLAWRFTPIAEVLTPRQVIDTTQALAAHWWAPLLLMLAYTPASVLMFPRPLITLALVVGFGPWHGFAYAMGGILLAALVAYAAGRRMAPERVRRMTGERLYRLSGVLRERGLLAMTAVRLVPLAPFAVESLFAGAIRIRVAHFVGGTFLGLSPGVLTATVFGGQLEAAIDNPGRINYLLVGAVLLALFGGTLLVRRWFARLEREHRSGLGKH